MTLESDRAGHQFFRALESKFFGHIMLPLNLFTLKPAILVICRLHDQPPQNLVAENSVGSSPMVLLVIWAQLGSPHLASPVGTPGNCSRGCRLPRAQLGWMATSHILLAVNAGCQQRAQQGLSTRALSCGLPLGSGITQQGSWIPKGSLPRTSIPRDQG